MNYKRGTPQTTLVACGLRPPWPVVDVQENFRRMPVISSGPCCDLKEDTPTRRTWVCRENGKISADYFENGDWKRGLDHGRLQA